jgi:hypothetical protein
MEIVIVMSYTNSVTLSAYIFQELTLDEIQKANSLLMKHCQPTTGVSDGE